jgi:hypothetical protein
MFHPRLPALTNTSRVDRGRPRVTETSAEESAEREADAKEPLPLTQAQALKPGWNEIPLHAPLPPPSVGPRPILCRFAAKVRCEPRPTAKATVTKPGEKNVKGSDAPILSPKSCPAMGTGWRGLERRSRKAVGLSSEQSRCVGAQKCRRLEKEGGNLLRGIPPTGEVYSSDAATQICPTRPPPFRDLHGDFGASVHRRLRLVAGNPLCFEQRECANGHNHDRSLYWRALQQRPGRL